MATDPFTSIFVPDGDPEGVRLVDYIDRAIRPFISDPWLTIRDFRGPLTATRQCQNGNVVLVR